MNWVATVYDPLRRPMCGGMRRKGQHSRSFGVPIFSALRSATCAPIPPPAISRLIAVLPIQRVLAGLEKAAGALKVRAAMGAMSID